jgi:hypothetical protein
MERYGDPETWENELHRTLSVEEGQLLKIAVEHFSTSPRDAFVVSDLVAKGYPKSHTSAVRWINKMQASGLVEKAIGTAFAMYYVTRYGRWRYERGGR